MCEYPLMPTKLRPPKQVRLDADTYASLRRLKEQCGFKITLGALANYSIRKGLPETERVFGKDGSTTTTTPKGK